MLEFGPRSLVWMIPEGSVSLSCTRALTQEELDGVTRCVEDFVRSLRHSFGTGIGEPGVRPPETTTNPVAGEHMTTRAILLRAAELIEERGHARGRFRSAKGGLCAYGAINVAVMGHHLRGRGDERERAAIDRAACALADTVANIVAWNDRSSGPTVCAGLRKAAEAAG